MVTKKAPTKVAVDKPYDFQADIQEFPGCCGIYVLAHLDEDSDVYTKNDAWKLRYSASNIAAKFLEDSDTDPTGFLFVATTIPSQTSAIAALKAGGWTPGRQFRNPNTGRTITVWELTIERK